MHTQRLLARLSAICLLCGRTTFGFLAFHQSNRHHTLATARSMSQCRATAKAEENNEGSIQTLRMLALHGSEGTGDDFVHRLSAYTEVLEDDYGTKLDVVAIDAPFPKAGGFAWWTMPPGVRSFNAPEYEGFQTSSDLVLQTLEAKGPFDVVYAHSQGAILTAALLALKRFPVFPKKGFLLNGSAWPNPYSKELSSLEYAAGEESRRVLIVTGLKDGINPPDTQEKVKEALQNAGAAVEVITHPGGHNIPMRRDESVKTIIDWMLQLQ